MVIIVCWYESIRPMCCVGVVFSGGRTQRKKKFPAVAENRFQSTSQQLLTWWLRWCAGWCLLVGWCWCRTSSVLMGAMWVNQDTYNSFVHFESTSGHRVLLGCYCGKGCQLVGKKIFRICSIYLFKVFGGIWKQLAMNFTKKTRQTLKTRGSAH